MGSKAVFLAAGALIALTSMALAQASERPDASSHVQLPPEDYIEIQQLYAMYSRDVDPGSARDASWMFTKDAVVVMGLRPAFSGEANIKKFYADLRKRVGKDGGMRHFNTSFVIVGTPDGGARGSSYMMEIKRKTQGGPAEITTFGKYEDKLVKTAEGWRIKERVWTADTFLGSDYPLMSSPVPGDRATDATGSDRKPAS